MSATSGRARFAERLWPPLHWWIVVVLAAVSFFAVFWTAFGTGVAAVIGIVVLVGMGAALVAYAADVAVDEDGLRAGRAALPWSAIGAVAALDAEAAAHLRGPGTDPRGYLLLRGYVRTAVRVDVDDPADPTPYWYVSTRRPGELAAALAHGRAPTS